MRGALLVCGTHSDAGKSVVTAGICRWLRREGVRVAPFKAQNMALNSVVAPDGSEIGRSQAMQAAAAGVEAEAAMNPILIKPSGERHSQVVVMGRPYADAGARSYQAMKNALRPVVADALAGLRARFDVVVCEGAGSPAEINLRESDLTNMGLARAAGLPVIIVADIDRGGVFASLYGTLALLDEADAAHVAGFVINKFRGDPGILEPGLARLESLTNRPVLGVLPYVEDLWLDVEDSVALESRPERPAHADTLDVAVLRLRWMSNFTDADALAAEPGVRVRFTRSPADVERADLVVVPGTKATVEDLDRLRRDGLDRALPARAAAGQPIPGIGGVNQAVGDHLDEGADTPGGAVDGPGVLRVRGAWAPTKERLVELSLCNGLGTVGAGCDIGDGRLERHGAEEVIGDEGCRVGNVLGLSWHGALEHDAFRRALLAHVAGVRARRFVPGTTPFADVRAAHLDTLGDLIAQHVDTGRLAELIEDGVPSGLPPLETKVLACSAS